MMPPMKGDAANILPAHVASELLAAFKAIPDRLAANLPANGMPHRGAFDSANQPSDGPANRHVGMPRGASLRPIRKLSMAACCR
jgi:hypothetical protein